jgi:outer membrane murein-binding lipoprotein Lpp
MQDLKKLGMTELIALHNDLAEKLGVSTETSFKSLGAARAAVTTLEQKMNQATNSDTPFHDTTNPEVPATDAPAASDADRSKYNSSGKRGPNQGVGAFAKELIVAGKTNTEVLAAVKERFPDAKTTTGCIAFYRTALSKGPQGKSPDQLRAEAQALLAKADAVEAARKAAEEAKAAKDAEAAAAPEAV